MKTLAAFLILWVGAALAAEYEVGDMIIIEPDEEPAARSGRQLYIDSYLGLGVPRITPVPATVIGAATDPEPACVTHEGQFGRCMTLNECYSERKIFKIEPKDTWIFGVLNACGHKTARGAQYFGHCCTRVAGIAPGSANKAAWPKLPSDNKNNLRNTPCDPKPTTHRCVKSVNRIVEGHEAPPNAYPFLAALMRKSSFSTRQFCGGSLIDESHVLTAAHCISEMSASDVKTLRVYLGVHDIKGSRTEHKVQRIIKNKYFNKETLENDIAILTLETPATMSSIIQPVCLPNAEFTRVGEEVTVSGWGALNESGVQPNKLHEVKVNVMSNAQCKQKYDHRIRGKIEDSMLCASAPGRDSCSGDSGGPLYATSSSTGQRMLYQVGIVSWGIGCARPDSPGVYTRVSKMFSWIENIQRCY